MVGRRHRTGRSSAPSSRAGAATARRANVRSVSTSMSACMSMQARAGACHEANTAGEGAMSRCGEMGLRMRFPRGCVSQGQVCQGCHVRQMGPHRAHLLLEEALLCHVLLCHLLHLQYRQLPRGLLDSCWRFVVQLLLLTPRPLLQLLLRRRRPSTRSQLISATLITAHWQN
jgi:hypothetical protein